MTTSEIRRSAAFLSPAIIVATYLGVDGFPWWSAALMGALLLPVGLVAYTIALVFIAHFSGSKVESGSLGAEVASYRAVAALLLVAVVYVWLQTGRDRAIDRIARCVDSLHEDGMKPSELVYECASQLDSDDSSE